MATKYKVLLGILIAVFFAGAILRLFMLSFDAGDIYPPYSSLRTDPLGTKAFYDTLDRISTIKVQRHYDLRKQLPPARQSVVVLLGTPPRDPVSPRLAKKLKNFVTNGGRLVVTFAAPDAHSSESPFEEKEKTETEEKKGNKPATENKESQSESDSTDADKTDDLDNPEFVPFFWIEKNSWTEYLGFTVTRQAHSHHPVANTATEVLATRTDAPLLKHLPGKVPWHTQLKIHPIGTAWQTLYVAPNGNPAIMERKLGKGSVVVAGESYLCSNEALMSSRKTPLLLWLLQERPEIVFDESHLGISERASLIGLAHEYRMTGILAVLLLLAILFIWKNAVSLVPPNSAPESAAGTRSSTGKDSRTALVTLLHRSISQDDLLKMCIEQWRKDMLKTGPEQSNQLLKDAEVIELEHSRPSRQKNPVAEYHEICRILAGKKGSIL